jgi:hypothetical protein
MYNHPATTTSQTKAPPPTSISAREAFLESCDRFSTWSLGDPEPTVPFEDDEISISTAAHLVATCQLLLPKSCRETLEYCDIEPVSKTFAAAAHALLAHIKQFKQTH